MPGDFIFGAFQAANYIDKMKKMLILPGRFLFSQPRTSAGSIQMRLTTLEVPPERRDAVVAMLQPRALVGKTVELRRCDGCGDDLRIIVDGSDIIGFRDHQIFRELLPWLDQACGHEAAACSQLRRQLNAHTWMPSYERVSLLFTPSPDEVRAYGRGRDDLQEAVNGLLDIVFRVGGDDR